MSEPALVTAAVAIGSNLGNRRGHIEAAVAALRHTRGVEVLALSRLIDNPAVGGPAASPPFLNGALLLRTSLTAERLLSRLLEVELALGRHRERKWEPRLIDLDLLLFGDQVINTPQLTVPHLLMHTRRFVLEPLAEIAPDAVHPRLHQTVRALLAMLQ